MLQEMPPEMQAAQDMGFSFFAGEAEDGRLDAVLLDAWNGALKPIYNYMDDLPSLKASRRPFAEEIAQRTLGAMSSIDLGRGCPFQCWFCTIINVQGRKSRFRTADDLERIIRENFAQGIKRFFITDDNFARNRRLGGLFRPHDPDEGRGRHRHRPHHPGRHALPPDSQFHREGDRRPACGASSSGWRTSIRTI